MNTERRSQILPPDTDEEIEAFVQARRLRAERLGIEQIAGEFEQLAEVHHREADACAELAALGGWRRGDPRLNRLLGVLHDCAIRQLEVCMFEIPGRLDLSPRVDQLRLRLLKTLPPVSDDPQRLHERASVAARTAGWLRAHLDAYKNCALALRQSATRAGGDLPDVGMHFLMEWAVANGANLADLAGRIARTGELPSAVPSSEPDPAEQWHTALRKAKSRFLRRQRQLAELKNRRRVASGTEPRS